MRKFLLGVLGTKTGISSKRFIGFIAAVAMIFVAIVDLFTDKTVSDYVFEGLMWLAIAGLGFVASERFADVLSSKSSTKNKPSDYYDPNQYPEDPNNCNR